MIFAVLFDSNEEELNKIEDFVSDAISLRGNDEVRFFSYKDEEELEEGIETIDLCEIIIAEFEGGGRSIDLIRKKFPTAPLLLVVDNSVSPIAYIRPGIMPSGLILRPLSDEDMEKNISDFLTASLSLKDSGSDEMIVVETKSGDIKVPISKVVYFESKAKKIYIRLLNEEYGYYDSLEHLETVLPDNFLRCHRGIIVNMDYAERYAATEKILYLKGDNLIPVSRSYNSDVRRWFKK